MENVLKQSLKTWYSRRLHQGMHADVITVMPGTSTSPSTATDNSGEKTLMVLKLLSIINPKIDFLQTWHGSRPKWKVQGHIFILIPTSLHQQVNSIPRSPLSAVKVPQFQQPLELKQLITSTTLRCICVHRPTNPDHPPATRQRSTAFSKRVPAAT